MSITHDAVNVANDSKAQMNIDINLDQNVIIYDLMPSLQHMSAVRIIISLWCRADIQHQIIQLSNKYGYFIYLPFTSIHKLWPEIGHKVLDGASQLPVPNRVRKILSNIVNPIGLEIYNWIRVNEKYLYSFDHIFHIYKTPKAINFIDDLVWTSRGRIDYKGTAKKLLDNKQLPNNVQYSLACTYCLEDDIAIIAPKVIGRLFLESLEKNAMLHFWTSSITGNFTELDKAVYSYNTENSTDYSMNECLFEVLIGDMTNQVAIKYIWDKLNDEEKSRQIGAATTQISDTDVKCYLLSKMSNEQQVVVFKNYASNVLVFLLDDWLWEEYFLPTVHNMWNVISERHFLNVLEAIVNKMNEIHQDIEKYDHYRATFKELWQCAPKHLKEYVFEHDNRNRGRSIFFRLFSEKNVDIIQSILFDCNYTQKKNIIFSDNSINECHFFITSNQWNLLEMFIRHTLVSEDDVNHFKQKLVTARGHIIAEHFIHYKEWEKIEQFIEWAFKSDDDTMEFRQGLTYSRICRNILKSIVANNKGDFTELELFLNWCASGDEERVARHKAEIPQLYFMDVICKSIEEDKFELLDQVLNWCFDNSQNEIDHFKQKSHDRISVSG